MALRILLQQDRIIFAVDFHDLRLDMGGDELSR